MEKKRSRARSKYPFSSESEEKVKRHRVTEKEDERRSEKKENKSHKHHRELESQKTISFTGTQQKCRACEKTAMELLTADGVPFQRSCFKCSHCKSTLQATQLRYVLKQRDR